MRVILFSTDVAVLRLLDGSLKCDEVIALVYPYNRRNSSKVQTLVGKAQQLGLACMEQPPREAVASFEAKLRQLNPDVGISWFYSQIVPFSILKIFSRTILNMHGGKIPEYRGASVLQWAIINGEKEIGITWHSMVEEVDAGGIWHESSVIIKDEDTAWTMRCKIAEKGIADFQAFWPGFRDGTLVPIHPDLTKGKTWSMRRPQDSQLPMGLSETQLKDFIRALCDPWPRPYVVSQNKELRVTGILPKTDSPSNRGWPYRLANGEEVRLMVEER